MKRNYNAQAFTPEEVEQGLLQDLLNYLLDYNKKNQTGYYDIHITSDGHCTIVEWTDVNYNNQYGYDPRFEFVDYNQQVMTELPLPDGCYRWIEQRYIQDEVEDAEKEFPDYKYNWALGSWEKR